MTADQMQNAWEPIQKLEAEMKSAGAWVFSARLHDPDTATVVRVSGGEVVTTDGPFVEAKEHLAGFYIIEAADLDEALGWASKVTRLISSPIEVWPFEEGQAIVRACLRRNHPGPYQIQAAINAVHADAGSIGATDWNQILALYDQLLAMQPTPVVAMNRAIAVAEVHGPTAGIAILDGLDLGEYHLFHAARADLLRRVGRVGDAAKAYERAAKLATSDAEHAFLVGRLQQLGSRGDEDVLESSR